MSFWKRLFSAFTPSQAGRSASRGGSSGKTSLLAMLLKENIKIDTNACGVDGATAAIATCTPLLIATEARIHGIALDVGGQCAICRAARCGEHSVWIAMPLEKFKSLGGKDLFVEGFDEIMDKLADITHKRLDMVFILGCRVCQRMYASANGFQTFVLVD